MASSAETWIIIGRRGNPLSDILGNVATFSSRAEAEAWLMPGERVGRRSELSE